MKSLGIFHSYIHLGYAFEFNQPAILAQGLAMACVHDPDSEKIAPIFLESEKQAGGPRQKGKKTLLQIMQEIRENKTLRGCIDGDNPIDRTKNVADNATNEMVKYAAQYSVSEDQLQERMDEMYDTCCKRAPQPNTNLRWFANLFHKLYSSPQSRRQSQMIKNTRLTSFYCIQSIHWS